MAGERRTGWLGRRQGNEIGREKREKEKESIKKR